MMKRKLLSKITSFVVVIALLLSSILILSIIGCDDKTHSNDNTSNVSHSSMDEETTIQDETQYNAVREKIEKYIDKIIAKCPSPNNSLEFLKYMEPGQKEFDELLEIPEETFQYSIRRLFQIRWHATSVNEYVEMHLEGMLCNNINETINARWGYGFLIPYRKYLLSYPDDLNEYDQYALSLLESRTTAEVIEDIMEYSDGIGHSSNPYDYIENRREEYEFLLKTPQKTFEGAFDYLSDTSDDGFDKYIAAVLINDINPDISISFYSSSDFYSKYVSYLINNSDNLNQYDKYALEHYNKHNKEFIEKYGEQGDVLNPNKCMWVGVIVSIVGVVLITAIVVVRKRKTKIKS